MPIEPYLFFNGRCDEAIQFYQRALGAKDVRIMRYKEAPEPPPPGMIPPGQREQGHAFELQDRRHDRDGLGWPGQRSARVQGILAVGDGSERRRGRADVQRPRRRRQVQMPIGKTFFASKFGMVADRFGVPWMVITAP